MTAASARRHRGRYQKNNSQDSFSKRSVLPSERKGHVCPAESDLFHNQPRATGETSRRPNGPSWSFLLEQDTHATWGVSDGVATHVREERQRMNTAEQGEELNGRQRFSPSTGSSTAFHYSIRFPVPLQRFPKNPPDTRSHKNVCPSFRQPFPRARVGRCVPWARLLLVETS